MTGMRHGTESGEVVNRCRELKERSQEWELGNRIKEKSLLCQFPVAPSKLSKLETSAQVC